MPEKVAKIIIELVDKVSDKLKKLDAIVKKATGKYTQEFQKVQPPDLKVEKSAKDLQATESRIRRLTKALSNYNIASKARFKAQMDEMKVGKYLAKLDEFRFMQLMDAYRKYKPLTEDQLKLMDEQMRKQYAIVEGLRKYMAAHKLNKLTLDEQVKLLGKLREKYQTLGKEIDKGRSRFIAFGNTMISMTKRLRSAAWTLTWSFLSFLGSTWQLEGAIAAVENPLKNVIDYFGNWQKSLEDIIMSIVMLSMANADTEEILSDIGFSVDDFIKKAIDMGAAIAFWKLSIWKVNDAIATGLIPGLEYASAKLLEIVSDERITDYLTALGAGFGTQLGEAATVFANNIDYVAEQINSFLQDTETLRRLGIEPLVGLLSEIPGLNVGEIFNKIAEATSNAKENIQGLNQQLPVLKEQSEDVDEWMPGLSKRFSNLGKSIGEAHNNAAELGADIADIYLKSKVLQKEIGPLMTALTGIQPTILLFAGALQFLGGAFTTLGSLISFVTSGALGMRIAMIGARIGIVGLIGVIGAVIVGIALLIKHLYDTNEAFRDLVQRGIQKVKDAFSSVLDLIEKIAFGFEHTLVDAIRTLVEKFVDLYNKLVGHSIIPDLARGMEENLMRMKGAMESLGFDVKARYEPQLVNVPVTVNIGTVSSEVDIEHLAEEIVDRINAIRRGYR